MRLGNSDGSRRADPPRASSSRSASWLGWYSGSAGMRSDLHRRSRTFFALVKTRFGLAERDAVGLPDHVAHRRAVVLTLQIGVVGVVPELVGGPVLVDQPDDLALVLREVGRELQPDHRVDLQAVGLGDVEAAPDRHLVRELARRVPLAGDLDEIGLVPGGSQGAHQRLGVRLRAAANERGLRMQDRDPHSAVAPGPGPERSALSRSTSASSDHDLLGQARGELGVIAEQPVVAPRGRAHHPPEASLQLAAPRRGRREVALAHRDHGMLVGAHLRGEVVQAVADLRSVHASPGRRLASPVHLAQELALCVSRRRRRIFRLHGSRG